MEIKHSSTNRTHVQCTHVHLPISCHSHLRHCPTSAPHVCCNSNPILDCLLFVGYSGVTFPNAGLHIFHQSPQAKFLRHGQDTECHHQGWLVSFLHCHLNIFAENIVIEQPSETVRSLTESENLLEDAHAEMRENKEHSQLRPKHTFLRLPELFPCKAEMLTIKCAMEGEPSFTVLFGASSVGKASLPISNSANQGFNWNIVILDSTSCRSALLRRIPCSSLWPPDCWICRPRKFVQQFQPIDGAIHQEKGGWL